FFFQAEDGIRARNVTGVQTCALPILVRLLLALVSVLMGRIRVCGCGRGSLRLLILRRFRRLLWRSLGRRLSRLGGGRWFGVEMIVSVGRWFFDDGPTSSGSF